MGRGAKFKDRGDELLEYWPRKKVKTIKDYTEGIDFILLDLEDEEEDEGIEP